MTHRFLPDPSGRVLLWSRLDRKAILVAPSYLFFFLFKKKRKKKRVLFINLFVMITLLFMTRFHFLSLSLKGCSLLTDFQLLVLVV